jgi:cytoskeletal protein CcmA (bactofilin family)
MFRKKESDPMRIGDRPSEASATRAPLEVRGPAQPEFGPRRVDLPSAGPGVGDPGPAAAVVHDEAGKRLIVGQGISLSGEITACDRLVVDGSVQVTLNQTRAIEITPSGRFTNGKAEVEEAEISGVYEGELTVRRRLLIRGTGQVKGTVRYGELEIERGGKLSGSVAMLEEGGSQPG